MARNQIYATNRARQLAYRIRSKAEPRRSLPYCSSCGSFAVYRKNGVGAPECLTCGNNVTLDLKNAE